MTGRHFYFKIVLIRYTHIVFYIHTPIEKQILRIYALLPIIIKLRYEYLKLKEHILRTKIYVKY